MITDVRTWKKYFLIELAKVFILFIGCFYFLYVLIDYSAHSKAFFGPQISFFDISLYYLYQFTKRADILIPIALMISTIKVLSMANVRNEIVALVTGGISLKTIMRPFLFVALLLSGFLYLNYQFLHPFSLNQIQLFEDQNFKSKSLDNQEKQVNALLLQDNTLLIYQRYDKQKETFFDAFWLKNFNHIYRIQSLFPFGEVPFGHFVDTLIRLDSGEVVKAESEEIVDFLDMQFDMQALFSAVHPPRGQSLTQLAHNFGWKQCKFGLGKMSDRSAEVGTLFFYKLTMPLICILAVIGPAPFCLRFGRHLPIFIIYALSLCGLITFFTFVNASVILGESQVLPPLCAILVPQATFFFIFGWKYVKI